MKFAVLMSLYYRESPKYLDKCLESLYMQSLQANEIVIVFDGNLTQNLENVINKWTNQLPITILRLFENVGLGKALKQGLKVCNHEWVIRMDTDDICVPDRFHLQMTYIKENPNIDVCGGQIYEFVDSIDEANLPIRKVPLEHHEIYQYAKSRNPINHMTVAYRKSAVLEVGNYHHAPMYEDYDLWVRMLFKGYTFANLPMVLVYARAGQSMYERRGGLKYVQTEIAMQKSFFNLGFISFTTIIKNLILRIPIRLLPLRLRGRVYSVFLRK